MFESKGKMGAKQIKEQLHTAWPVPDSRSQMEALKRELQAEMRRSLELVSKIIVTCTVLVCEYLFCNLLLLCMYMYGGVNQVCLCLVVVLCE